MRARFAGPLLWLVLWACADAQPPVEPADASLIEIADGRTDMPWSDLSEWLTRPVMQQALEAARAYWRGQDPNYEEAVRLFGVADGAFTEPGAGQQAVLYVMSVWPRCCPKTGLAVVEGTRLVRNVAFEGIVQGLAAVPDLNGDGRAELAFTGSFGMGGQESRSVTLASFGDDGLMGWGTTPIYDSSCASGMGDVESTASHIVAGPGPAFMVEHFTLSSCDGATPWQSVGRAEPLALEPPGGSPYVELPVE